MKVELAVDCQTNSFTVGGTVTGMTGEGLVLQNNSGDDLLIAENGSFHFLTGLEEGSQYFVSVISQPHSPNQVCVVGNAGGTVLSASVTNITVNCETLRYSVSGSVSGMSGTGMVLQLNGGNDIVINEDGPFNFATQLDDGSAWQVTVKSQPTGPIEVCNASFSTGILNGSDVTDVKIINGSDVTDVKIICAIFKNGFE